MKQTSKKSLVIHPFLFAIFPIIFLFSFNVDIVSPHDIFFPLIILLSVTFLLWILLGFIFKNRKKSGLLVSLGIVLFSMYGHIYLLLQGDVFAKDPIPHELFLLVFLGFFIIGAVFLFKTKRTLDNATTIVNVIAISIIMISLVNIGTYYLGTSSLEENTVTIEVNENSKNLPDIYYIVLDEYAREDLLLEYLDFDNSEFINFLSENGFYVSPKSFSNYPRTTVSIPSTLNMEYIHQDVDEMGIPSLNLKAVKSIISQNEVMKYLKSKGYSTFTHNSGHTPTKKIEFADYTLCDDVNNLDSEFIPLYLRTTMLMPVHVQFFAGDYRDRILCIFTELQHMPEREEKPKFVFAHIMLPHQPYVFGENGEPIIPEAINKLNMAWDKDRYLGQTKFVNKKMEEVIPYLLNSNEKPIIIILSDHGMRYGPDGNYWENPTHEFLEKRFGNFKAYYFPEKGQNLLFENTTNVNTFRILFNLYFDENFEILEDRIFVSPGKDGQYNFTEATDILFLN